MRRTVAVTKTDNVRRPDLPDGTPFTVVEDHGDTMLVDVPVDVEAEVADLRAQVQEARSIAEEARTTAREARDRRP